MSTIGVKYFTGGGIPYLHSFIQRTRSDALAVRRPGNACHMRHMSMIREEQVCNIDLPDLHRGIISTRGDAYAIWGPCHGMHFICMTMKGDRMISGLIVP